MRFALGMDNREIARALGRSDGATKVLIHRAIKQLQEEMSDDERRRNAAGTSRGCWPTRCADRAARAALGPDRGHLAAITQAAAEELSDGRRNSPRASCGRCATRATGCGRWSRSAPAASRPGTGHVRAAPPQPPKARAAYAPRRRRALAALASPPRGGGGRGEAAAGRAAVEGVVAAVGGEEAETAGGCRARTPGRQGGEEGAAGARRGAPRRCRRAARGRRRHVQEVEPGVDLEHAQRRLDDARGAEGGAVEEAQDAQGQEIPHRGGVEAGGAAGPPRRRL